MKKIILFAALAFVAFTSDGCSGSGDETTAINRVTLEVDGFVKVFNYVTVDAGNATEIHIRGQIGSEVLEIIEIDLYKNATGTSAIYNLTFTQNNVEYYGLGGGNVYSNVTANGADRKVKGNFEGNFKTLSNNTKVITNGSFTVTY